jgi:putative tryptophan/tyrosine transport system substrate-binding protein
MNNRRKLLLALGAGMVSVVGRVPAAAHDPGGDHLQRQPGRRRLRGRHRERTASEDAARKLGIRTLHYPVRSGPELDAALIEARTAGAEGVVAFPDGVTYPNRSAIAEFSMRYKLPVVAGWASFVEAGCLLSYGPNQHASYARAAFFVDRIINGRSPADLPIELPSVVELAVNRKTARALDIRIPASILARADRMIE